MQISICPDLKAALPEQEGIKQIRDVRKQPWKPMESAQLPWFISGGWCGPVQRWWRPGLWVQVGRCVLSRQGRASFSYTLWNASLAAAPRLGAAGSPSIKPSEDALGVRCRLAARASPPSDLKSPPAQRNPVPPPQHELPTAGLGLRTAGAGRGSRGGDRASQGRGSVAGGRSWERPGRAPPGGDYSLSQALAEGPRRKGRSSAPGSPWCAA